MTSIFRNFRSNSYNRHSTTSTLTHSSTKTDIEASKSNISAKSTRRVLSKFDLRASWTPGTMSTLEDQDISALWALNNSNGNGSINANENLNENCNEDGNENTNTNANINTSTLATSIDTSTPESSKRFRNITPKIRALKARFEFRAADVHDLERESLLATTPSPSKRHYIQEARAVVDDAVSMSATDTPASPFGTRALHLLRSAPSMSDMKRKKLVFREKRHRPISDSGEKLLVCDERLEKIWDDKINALVYWAKNGSLKGEAVPDFVFIVNDRIRKRDGSHDSLLTPEEDLKQCVDKSNCHPYLTPYFAKVLDDVKTTFSQTYGQERPNSPIDEAALYIVHHPCRVPLILRIEAAHTLLNSNWAQTFSHHRPCVHQHIFELLLDVNDQTYVWNQHECQVHEIDLILLAWKWCHQLETTALVVRLMHRTQQFWNQVFGNLKLLPDLIYQPPIGGYVVKNPKRCI